MDVFASKADEYLAEREPPADPESTRRRNVALLMAGIGAGAVLAAAVIKHNKPQSGDEAD